MGEGVALLQELAHQGASRRNDEILFLALQNLEKRFAWVDIAQWKMMSPQAQNDYIEMLRNMGYDCYPSILSAIMEVQPMSAPGPAKFLTPRDWIAAGREAKAIRASIAAGTVPTGVDVRDQVHDVGVRRDLEAVHGKEIFRETKLGPGFLPTPKAYCGRCDRLTCNCSDRYTKRLIYSSPSISVTCDLHHRIDCPTCA